MVALFSPTNFSSASSSLQVLSTELCSALVTGSNGDYSVSLKISENSESERVKEQRSYSPEGTGLEDSQPFYQSLA